MKLLRSDRVTAWPPDLEDLYASERLRFVRLAYLLTSRHDVAEEIVQDAFVACAPKWSGIDQPRAYLRATVTNGARTWMRRTKLDRERSPVSPESEEMEPDELWDSLSRLDEKRRTAIVLRFYEDLPDSEIAEILEVRPATVRSLVHRGLGDLRQEVTR